LYLGKQYRLAVIYDKEIRNDEVKLYRGKLQVTLSSVSGPSEQSLRIKKLLEKFYRLKAEQMFNETLNLVIGKFGKYQLPAVKIQVRQMKTRWGSCSPNGLILLNPALIKAPKASIEYVLIHELCHLVERNHTKEFYILLERMMPDWKFWKDKLEYCLS